jgi:hypothetical protein
MSRLKRQGGGECVEEGMVVVANSWQATAISSLNE